MRAAIDGLVMDAARWAPREISESLRDLNLRFLEVLRGGFVSHQRLPTHDLTMKQCEAVACYPYALFDLGFGNTARWQLRLATAQPWQVADSAYGDTRLVELTRLALFLVWHVVRVQAVSAELMFGLAPPAAQAFRAVSLQRLAALAAESSQELAPRWRESGAFWGAVFRAAATGDPLRLERAQLHGVQLAAAARLKLARPD